MRPNTSSVAGQGNRSVSLDHADGDARRERRVADEVGHREHDDSAADRERRPGREGLRGRDVGCPAHLDSRASTAGRAWSSIERVLMATRDMASIAALLGCVQPVPRSASRPHLRGWRRLCPARSRIGPDLKSTGSGERTHDNQMLRVARTSARLDPVLRRRVGTRADDVDRPIYRVRARSAQSSSPVGSSREPGEATPTDRRWSSAASIPLCNLSARVDAIERAPGRGAWRTRSTPRPAAFRTLPPGTSSRLVREGARRRMRGCIRPCLHDVDDVGVDRRQGVDGLGADSVDGARCRSVAL